MVVYEDIMPTNMKGKVRCRICDCFIPYSHYCINQHIDGNAHRANYLEKLKKKHNIKVYDDEVRCHLCDDWVHSVEDLEYIQEHVEEYDHQFVYNYLIELCGEYLILPDGISGSVVVRCTLCSCNLGFNESVLKQHINGNRHQNAQCNALQANNAIFDNCEDEESWCKLCDVIIPYCIPDIMAHAEDPGHISLLEEIEEIISDEDININQYLSVREQDKAYCERCECFVPCAVQNLYQHVNGYRHNK